MPCGKWILHWGRIESKVDSTWQLTLVFAGICWTLMNKTIFVGANKNWLRLSRVFFVFFIKSLTLNPVSVPLFDVWFVSLLTLICCNCPPDAAYCSCLNAFGLWQSVRRASDETFVLCYFCALQNNEEKANVNFKHCSLNCWVVGGFMPFLTVERWQEARESDVTWNDTKSSSHTGDLVVILHY